MDVYKRILYTFIYVHIFIFIYIQYINTVEVKFTRLGISQHILIVICNIQTSYQEYSHRINKNIIIPPFCRFVILNDRLIR